MVYVALVSKKMNICSSKPGGGKQSDYWMKSIWFIAQTVQIARAVKGMQYDEWMKEWKVHGASNEEAHRPFAKTPTLNS